MIRLTGAFLGLLALPCAAAAHAAEYSSDQTPAPAAVGDDPLAGFVRASGTFEAGTHRYLVEFLQDGDRAAALRVRGDHETEAVIHPFANPAAVLTVLADRRLSFVWQPLLQWTGPSLELFRTRTVANARAAYAQQAFGRVATSTAESTMRPGVRALVQFARALAAFGHWTEAVNLLRPELARANLRSDRGKTEYFAIAGYISNFLRDRGDFSGALAVLAEAEAALRGTRFAANPIVNRAALLVESGNYADALTAVTEAIRLHESGGDRIPGSERNFAWIRACALNGLGRTAEAQAALGPVLREEEIHDRDFVITGTRSLRRRAFFCMKDLDVVVRDLVSVIEQAPFAPSVFLLLQPARRSASLDPAFIARIRSDPRIAAAVRDRMRILPADLEPALNHWRAAQSE